MPLKRLPPGHRVLAVAPARLVRLEGPLGGLTEGRDGGLVLLGEGVVLTAARSGEARGATWDEVHKDAREWRIPGARMKGGVDHRVPLSDPALAVLDQARSLRDESGLIFPSPMRRGQPMSDMTLTKVLRATGLAERGTVHGFRSAFRDWAAECTDAPHAVMELSLAHAVGSSVEQAYARSDLIGKRHALMQRWADYVTSARVDVVRLHG